MVPKLLKVLVFIYLACAGTIFAESKDNLPADENILGARILSLNRQHNFVVIDAGAEEGIGEGMHLNLLKDGRSVAVLQVLRTKERVSACDIKHLEPGLVLKEGDIYSLKISTKWPKSMPRLSPQKKEEKKEKSVIKKITSLVKGEDDKKKMPPFIGALPMMVHIEARKEVVNYYLNETLRNLDFVVTSVNTKDGMFTAHKLLSLSFWDEVWADFKGTTEQRAVYDIATIDDEAGTTLRMDIRLYYTDKKGVTRERSVRQNSETLKAALELVKRVKNMSENLTRER
jgi:hypothetical protein